MADLPDPLSRPAPVAEPHRLTRRAVLGGLSAGAALTAAGVLWPGMAGAASSGPDATPDAGSAAADLQSEAGAQARSAACDRDAVRRGLGFLQTMTDAYPASNPGPRLAQSYADELGLFSSAFVYDNALAICAALAAGPSGLSLARTLGDGLVFAAANDPDYSDGRLRQAYNVGPYTFYDGNRSPAGFVRADGKANVGWQFGFLGTAVGDMAWAGIALAQLYRRTKAPAYLATALRIGRWITRTTLNPGALGGFSIGVDGGNVSKPNVSTEHNIDCVALFGMLRTLTGDAAWTAAQRRARGFVDKMWNATDGFFWTGSNDGTTINQSPRPLDPQTWSWLALRDRRYARALDWAGRELAVTDNGTGPNSEVLEGVSVSGVTFSDTSRTSTAQYNGRPVEQSGVWLEGTAQQATSLADRGGGADRRAADALLAQVRTAQDRLGFGTAPGTPQHVGGADLPAGGGVVAATSLIDTGFNFGYFRVQHVGATSWYVMAARRVNPLRLGL
ncbi:Tat pathway signal sequence domain protein [Nakamurella flava]|uniref:Tat pathway signal sequence domain protein n=1 Tax=Nakamurella flava TaxID=2576308 RepID=A0A4U6QFC9_9ACTN|nr:Tat pathway signal sequence domain protein [Nakamurella flava]TKV58778.1 Tat pathway signal sequence domain protein [Nakamurella flava]